MCDTNRDAYKTQVANQKIDNMKIEVVRKRFLLVLAEADCSLLNFWFNVRKLAMRFWKQSKLS